MKEVQIPFASLKPAAMFRVGGTADWILVTDDAVWVSSSKPDSVERIGPANNKIVAEVSLPGEACLGLAFGFTSLWVPLCGKEPSLVRVSVLTNGIRATLRPGRRVRKEESSPAPTIFGLSETRTARSVESIQ